MLRRWAVLLFVATAATLVAVATPARATTLNVNSTADTVDPTPDGACSASCTLREAMREASANQNAPAVDLINFSIPGDGPRNILPTTELPDIDDPLTIDGYTQGDSTPANVEIIGFRGGGPRPVRVGRLTRDNAEGPCSLTLLSFRTLRARKSGWRNRLLDIAYQ